MFVLFKYLMNTTTKHRTKSHGTALMKPPIGIVMAFAKDYSVVGVTPNSQGFIAKSPAYFN
jgi:hypothetical protein